MPPKSEEFGTGTTLNHLRSPMQRVIGPGIIIMVKIGSPTTSQTTAPGSTRTGTMTAITVRKLVVNGTRNPALMRNGLAQDALVNWLAVTVVQANVTPLTGAGPV